jgi:hypothetical protein
MDFVLPDGLRVHLIGDPHLGKKFEQGVSLRNRGKREASQFQDFRDRLEVDADLIIMVGDLFDHPYVGYAVVTETQQALVSAALNNPDVTYVMMAGNHDMPRNTTAVGAFHDLEERLGGRYENLLIARRPMVVKSVALFPWEWDRRADEQVSDLAGETGILTVVGHWDLTLFDAEKDKHFVPIKELRAAFGDVPLWSGHYHVPGRYGEVICTGSLQPYSHGEDPAGRLYLTITADEARSRPADDFKGKHVRVLLKPGEDLPDLDALAVTQKRVKVDEQPTKVTASLADFDWNKILSERIAKLDPKVRDFIKERLPYEDTTAEQHDGSPEAVRQGETDGNTSEG